MTTSTNTTLSFPLDYYSAAKTLSQIVFFNGRALLKPENMKPYAGLLTKNTDRAMLMAERLQKAAAFYDTPAGQKILSAVNDDGKRQEILRITEQLKAQGKVLVNPRGFKTHVRFMQFTTEFDPVQQSNILKMDQLVTDDARQSASGKSGLDKVTTAIRLAF